MAQATVYMLIHYHYDDYQDFENKNFSLPLVIAKSKRMRKDEVINNAPPFVNLCQTHTLKIFSKTFITIL